MTRGRGRTKLSGPARRGVRNGPSFPPPSSAIGVPKGGNPLRAAASSACGVLSRKEPGTSVCCTYQVGSSSHCSNFNYRLHFGVRAVTSTSLAKLPIHYPRCLI